MNESNTKNVKANKKPDRKVYRTPRLVVYGNVRELTLNSSMSGQVWDWGVWRYRTR